MKNEYENYTNTGLTRNDEVKAYSVRVGSSLYNFDCLILESIDMICTAAKVLEDGEYLGLEFFVDSDYDCRGYVFSNAHGHVTKEDFQLLFKSILEFTEADQGVEELFRDRDFAYVFRVDESTKPSAAKDVEESDPAAEDDEEPDPAAEGDEEPETGGYIESFGSKMLALTEFMQKTGERICFYFGKEADNETYKMCLYSKKKISLGVRTIMSMLFTNAQFVEVDPKNLLKEQRGISETFAKNMLYGFLQAYTRIQYRQKGFEADEEHIGSAVSFDDIDDIGNLIPDEEEESSSAHHHDSSDSDGKVPIKELELSYPTQYMLERAGINTIGELRKMSVDGLRSLRSLDEYGIYEVRDRFAQYEKMREERFAKKTDYFEMLNGLIGLHAVKEQVRKLAAYVRLKRDMEEKSLGSLVPIAMNMEFVGNPGTAKTTVARSLAGILCDVGLLEQGDIVEVGCTDLVGRYLGQTVNMVKEVFRNAKGKLLFIDAAYALLESDEGTFGDKVINAIVQEMENHRKETVVIFAGYPKVMDEFMKRNPGLRSRVPFRIEFQDYSAEEMVQIAECDATDRGFSMDEAAREKVFHICAECSGKKELGNGWFSRNLVDGAILNYAARVYVSAADADPSGGFILRAEDFPSLNLSKA